MTYRKLLLCLSLALALTACATSPSDQVVLDRLDSIERSMTELCAYRDTRSEAQFAGLGRVQEMVTEIHGHVLADARSRQDAAQRECARASLDTGEKLVLGRAEWVGMPGFGSYFKARLDTGANTSSLSATDITRFERDGENWVRFRLAVTEDDSVVPDVLGKEFEARVVRQVRIVQASGTDRRPVVRLPLTLGPIEQQVEFTLNDRSHLTYPVLLGRRFMLDMAVIDISRAYTHPRPEFPGGEPASGAADEQDDGDLDEE